MKISVFALVSAFVVGCPVSAQTAPATSMPLTVGGPSVQILRTGTKVPLKLGEELTTKEKKLRVGQHFNLEVTEPVFVNGQTVIPLGAPAVGEITEVRNKGMWGKSGRLVAQMLYVTVNGRQIKLTGTFDEKGHGGGGAAAATSAVIFLPAGFFMTGTSAKVAMGTPVTGFVGEDVPLAFATSTIQPLTVTVPSAAVPSVANSPGATVPPMAKQLSH